MDSNLDPAEMFSMIHYVNKFVSDLRQVSGFLKILSFPPSIKLTGTTEILLKVALSTITLTLISESLILRVHICSFAEYDSVFVHSLICLCIVHFCWILVSIENRLFCRFILTKL